MEGFCHGKIHTTEKVLWVAIYAKTASPVLTPLPYNKNYTSQENDAVSTLLSAAGPPYYAEAGANGIHLPGWIVCGTYWDLSSHYQAPLGSQKILHFLQCLNSPSSALANEFTIFFSMLKKSDESADFKVYPTSWLSYKKALEPILVLSDLVMEWSSHLPLLFQIH